jgi:hypothetical protein
VEAAQDLRSDFEKVLGKKSRIGHHIEGADSVTVLIDEESKLPEGLRPKGLTDPGSFSISVVRDGDGKSRPIRTAFFAVVWLWVCCWFFRLWPPPMETERTRKHSIQRFFQRHVTLLHSDRLVGEMTIRQRHDCCIQREAVKPKWKSRLLLAKTARLQDGGSG